MREVMSIENIQLYLIDLFTSHERQNVMLAFLVLHNVSVMKRGNVSNKYVDHSIHVRQTFFFKIILDKPFIEHDLYMFMFVNFRDKSYRHSPHKKIHVRRESYLHEFAMTCK